MSRPSPYGDVLALADQALSSETGIKVSCTTERHATNLRMRFYAKRDEMRDLGNSKYDDLTVTIAEGGSVVVFRKKLTTTAIEGVRAI